MTLKYGLLLLGFSSTLSAYQGGSSLSQHTHSSTAQGGSLSDARATGILDVDTMTIRGQLNALVSTFRSSVSFINTITEFSSTTVLINGDDAVPLRIGVSSLTYLSAGFLGLNNANPTNQIHPSNGNLVI